MRLHDVVIHEADAVRIDAVLRRFLADAGGAAALLIDRSGQPLAEAGTARTLDVGSIGALAAAAFSSTAALARLLGESEFSVLFHEGQRDHIHISIVAKRAILLVIFDERSSLGLVRLRVKRANQELEQIFEDMLKKGERSTGPVAPASPFAEITDEDIDALFSE